MDFCICVVVITFTVLICHSLNRRGLPKIMRAVGCVLLICLFGLMGRTEPEQAKKIEKLLKALEDQNQGLVLHAA